MYAPSGLLRGGVPKGRSRTARPSSLSSFWLPDNSFPPSATGCLFVAPLLWSAAQRLLEGSLAPLDTIERGLGEGFHTPPLCGIGYFV